MGFIGFGGLLGVSKSKAWNIYSFFLVEHGIFIIIKGGLRIVLCMDMVSPR